MEAYQQRVVDEKIELDAKIEKLISFMAGGMDKVNALQASLLGRQLELMQEYSVILGERVRDFHAPG